MLGKGEVIAEQYRIAEKLGEGGMGTVWLAIDQTHSREVAVKVLHKTLVTDPNAVARFRHEARAAAKLHHPHICRVIDVGDYDGSPYIVMERLTGENLAERLARERSIPPIPAAEILLQVLDALSAAHAEGVLHRDLKPENVFLAHENDRIVAKIVDFGVAKFIGDDAERVKMTRTGALVGTPAYMSPEQALGEDDIDVRSDVWAAGVLLYEMIAGKLPYEAANYNAMLVKIATEAPQPIEALLPTLDSNVVQIIRGAMARDRNVRMASATEMADAVRGWLDGAPLRLGRSRVAMPTPDVVTTPMSWAEASSLPIGTRVVTLADHPTRAGSRGWLLPAVLAVVLGGAGLTMWRGMSRRSDRGSAVVALATASALPGREPIAAPDASVESYQLAIVGLPLDAHVLVNDALAQLPVSVRRGEAARIAVTVPGFELWTQTVMPTGDVELTYEGRRTVAPVAIAVVNADAGVAHTRGARARNTRRGQSEAGAHSSVPLQGGVAPRPDF